MTVSTGVARERYIGSNSTGPFSFNYRLYSDEHLTIVKTDVDGIDTELALTTDYTVTPASDFSSATITLVEQLDGDGVDDGGSEVITVTRDPPIQQLTRWPRNDPFPAATHERAADLAVMMIGRLNEKIGRSILLPESSTLSGLQIPSPLANYAIGWNAAADNLANVGVPTAYVQASEPTGIIILNSIWIDSDSTDLDLYKHNGTSWIDTGVNLKGDQGVQGDPGNDGADGEVLSSGASVAGNLASFTDTTGDEIEDSGLAKATDAQVRSSAANKLITGDLIESASAAVALTDAASIALNWDLGFNFTVTLTDNRTLANPTNGQPGTWRRVQVTQDGTGSRTLAYDTNYHHPGGTAPTLTTDAAAVDTLYIYCRTTSIFEVHTGGLAWAAS